MTISMKEQDQMPGDVSDIISSYIPTHIVNIYTILVILLMPSNLFKITILDGIP